VTGRLTVEELLYVEKMARDNFYLTRSTCRLMVPRLAAEIRRLRGIIALLTTTPAALPSREEGNRIMLTLLNESRAIRKEGGP
jgi:hypothetical protein